MQEPRAAMEPEEPLPRSRLPEARSGLVALQRAKFAEQGLRLGGAVC